MYPGEESPVNYSENKQHQNIIRPWTRVLGPIEVSSIGGSKYDITFVDDYSNWTVEYTMKEKSEALGCFKNYKAYAETHTSKKLQKLKVFESMSKEDHSKSFESKLKVLRSDNSGEYLSNEFKAYLAQHGIKHELTVAYTPQQNGVAERMNRTLLDLTRAMLHHKNIDKIFWAEALTTAVYIRNRVTSRALFPNLTWRSTYAVEPPCLRIKMLVYHPSEES